MLRTKFARRGTRGTRNPTVGSKLGSEGVGVEDYQAMRESPAPLPYLRQALAIATFKPGMYEVVEIYSGQQGPNWQ